MTEPWGTLLVPVDLMEANLSRRIECGMTNARGMSMVKNTESAAVDHLDQRRLCTVSGAEPRLRLNLKLK